MKTRSVANIAMSPDILNDTGLRELVTRWAIFRAFPGLEREAVAAWKQVLQMGGGLGKIGPKGKLP